MENLEIYEDIANRTDGDIYVGGIVGSLIGNITQCNNNGVITAKYVEESPSNNKGVGGIAGGIIALIATDK